MLNSSILNYLICLFLACAQSVSAQNSVLKDLSYGWELTSNVVKRPVVNQNDVVATVAFLGVGTALLLTQDADLNRAVQQGTSNGKDVLATYIGEPFGNPIYQAALVGGTYLTSKWLKKTDLTEKSVRTLSALTFSGVTVQLLKHTFSRARPYIGAGSDAFFSNYFSGADYLSFPSGHTIMAFTFASSVTHLYPNQVWIPLVVYPLAGITAWSRMYDQKHWASDVLVGAVLGHFIGKAFAQKENIKLGVAPMNGNGVGVSASINF